MPGRAQSRAQRAIPAQAYHGRRDRAWVVRRHDKRRALVVQELLHRAGGGGDDRPAARERLERDAAERLLPSGGDEHDVRGAVCGDHPLPIAPAVEPNAPAGAELCRQRPEPRLLPAGAHDVERRVGHVRQRADHEVHALQPRQPADVQQPAAPRALGREPQSRQVHAPWHERRVAYGDAGRRHLPAQRSGDEQPLRGVVETGDASLAPRVAPRAVDHPRVAHHAHRRHAGAAHALDQRHRQLAQPPEAHYVRTPPERLTQHRGRAPLIPRRLRERDAPRRDPEPRKQPPDRGIAHARAGTGEHDRLVPVAPEMIDERVALKLVSAGGRGWKVGAYAEDPHAARASA